MLLFSLHQSTNGSVSIRRIPLLAYDFAPHSWINECIHMFGIGDNVRNLLKMSMEQWKLSLMSNGEDLGEVNVKRDISRDCLSPILFVLSMVPVTKIPRPLFMCLCM